MRAGHPPRHSKANNTQRKEILQGVDSDNEALCTSRINVTSGTSHHVCSYVCFELPFTHGRAVQPDRNLRALRGTGESSKDKQR